MQLVERSALVTYTAAQMFALVNDVARYPEFLPWCTDARVEDGAAGERIATLRVARGVLRTEFTTRNTLRQDEQIQMKLPGRSAICTVVALGDRARGSRVHGGFDQEPPDRDRFRAVFGPCAAPSSRPSCSARQVTRQARRPVIGQLQIKGVCQPQRVISRSICRAPRRRPWRWRARRISRAWIRFAFGIFGKVVGRAGAQEAA